MMHEIWIGKYNMGQGYGEPDAPQLLALIKASSFKLACLLYELEHKLNFLKKEDEAGKYVSLQDFEWFYNPTKNYNSWTGAYYSNREEALKSFL